MQTLLILYTPIFITLFWVFLLGLWSDDKPTPKIWLGRIMFVLMLIYIGQLIYFTFNIKLFVAIEPLYEYLKLLLLPMLYIFVRMMTVDSQICRRVVLYGIIAPTLVIIPYIFFYVKAGKEAVAYLHYTILPNGLTSTGVVESLRWCYMMCKTVYVGQAVVYLFLILHAIHINRSNIKNYYSNVSEHSIMLGNIMSLCIIALLITGITASIIGKENLLYSNNVRRIPAFMFGLILFATGLVGSMQQNRMATSQTDEPSTVIQPTVEELKTIPKVKTLIELQFLDNKIFLNKNLNINDLATLLGTNRSYVSKVINDTWGVNFCSLVNKYRIDYAKNIIENNPDISNDELAELSGFGSTNSLLRSFVLVEQMSVKRFRDIITLDKNIRA